MEKLDGRIAVIVMGIWMLVKGIFNLIFGFNISGIFTLVVSVGLLVTVYLGISYMNIITAVILSIIVLTYLPGNIIGHHFVYLAEAAVDIVCVLLLIVNNDIKEHCSKKND